MEKQFEATLTGSDSPLDGIATQITYNGQPNAYEFNSIDESLHLIIVKNEHGHWERVAGTEPYFSGWVDELVQQIV
jgi:hypothetical protein